MTLRHDPFTAGFGEQSGTTHWPSMLPDEAQPAWAELRDWVEHLVDRFALETRVIPPCWYRHNTLVESLSALRDHERLCFAPSGAVYWFRALREVEQRMSQACTDPVLNQRTPPRPDRTWTTDQAVWQTFLDEDVEGRELRIIDEGLADR